MAKIERGTAGHKYFTVLVEPNELVVASGKRLPYSTWVGTISATGRIHVWSPAASKPRGYREAAKRILEDARAELCSRGDVKGKSCPR
jgi:hypothetical protein